MRLLVLALAVTALVMPALAPPALARDPIRYHHHYHRVVALHSYRHVAWRGGDERARGDVSAWRSWREPADVNAERSRSIAATGAGSHGELDAMIARHAQANGLPEALVHRVVIRESRYSPRVIGAGGAMGLMQIKYGTAREMGYTGTPAGLLDPETNLTYAVRYLAGAYRVAGGNADRAVANYARGYRDVAARPAASPYGANEWSGRYAQGYAQAQPIERTAYVRTFDRDGGSSSGLHRRSRWH
jgi:soluble lytic murein transglycosylase-like protein